ncbi:MAG: hypothetical protein M1820_007301 [Bogoriella megaspora]|nr:MAG: hypothetical protein M1820_007301 [Bogoriella megaspora]
MGFFKSYLTPNKEAKNKQSKAEKDAEKSTTVVDPMQEMSTPKFPFSPGQTPGMSPWASQPGSRPGSLYQSDEMTDIKCNVVVAHLYQQQLERLWTSGADDEGVVLKKGRGQYTACPSELTQTEAGFYDAVVALNVRCALTVSTRVIKLFLHHNTQAYVPLRDGLRLQVLPDISWLPRCQKHQFAAFIADRGVLIVWDDQPRHILERTRNIETQLMDMIWATEDEEKMGTKPPSVMINEVDSEEDAEQGAITFKRRPVLWQPVFTAFALFLAITAMGTGWRQIAVETFVDSTYLRMAFFLACPIQIWLAFFFFQALVGNVGQIIGPVKQMSENSKFYSGKPPRRLQSDNGTLPHVTIQMPVYKEGLAAVIEPTIRSIKAAISTYEMQGGTANIFVNDDGMQLISEDDARARMDFYDEHNIGWVARPKHNPKPAEGERQFLRRGKFKKASNMNYSLWVSNRVEEKLNQLERHDQWNNENEAEAYRNALADVVAEDDGRTWADGNVRIGDYILLIDSDTRVPADCFLDAVSEMEHSPEVAIIQYSSGVMNVTDSFFEKGITFFTDLVYTQIRYAVANGDVAPFVGHNAVLRWAAVQSIGYDCKDDNREKYWSEATVSEDFDMALRLQTTGYLCRLAGYTGNGFQEGVSLTVYDELSRWEKYAYGCNELIFWPLKDWPRHGPFTPLFRRFIGSNMPLPSKFTIMSYVGTYYAIGSAWLLTLANYFFTGWMNGYLDHYYLDSFKVYFAIIIVFSALGNVALAVLRYRIEERTFIAAFIENFKWIPLLTIFLGGISLHVSQAILSHMFSIDMSWGATAKEVENSTFFKEVPKVIKNFKYTFIICILLSAMMVVMAHFVPYLWRIDLLISIFPLSTIVVSHFLLPIALNPNLMLFTW